MAEVYKCEKCNQSYPGKRPKFCVKCGNKLAAISSTRAPVAQVIPSSMIKTRSAPHQSKMIQKRRFGPSREFRVIDNDLIFVLISCFIFFSGFEAGLVIGWAGIIISGMIYNRSSTKLAYRDPNKSLSPFIIVALTSIITISQLGRYTTFWLANIVLYTVVYYFTPPKEIIEDHLESQNVKIQNTPLIIGGIMYVIFMLNGVPFLGALLSIAFAVYYLYSIHSPLLLVKTPIPIERGSQVADSQSYALAPTIIRGFEPIIDPHGTMPGLNNQLNDALSKIRYQVDNFNLNLERINEQYNALTKIIEEDLNNQLIYLNENLESDHINSKNVESIMRGIDNIKAQVSRFVNERDLLLQTYHQDYQSNVISSLEELLHIAKDNQVKISDSINSSEMFEGEPNLNKLDKIQSELETLNIKLIEREILLEQELLNRQQAIEKEKEELIEIRSFKLQALISEKVVSNLFAYVGAAFIIAGFLFLLNYTYQNYILANFPETAPFDDARFGIAFLYILSILIITLPAWVLDKIGINFKIISPIFMSSGLLFLQLTLYVQAFYFVNLDLKDGTFTLIGTVIVLAAFTIAYLWKSQMIGLTATEFGVWLYYISANNDLVNKYLITLGFLLLLLTSYWFVYKRGLWIPLATLSLFTPVLWMVIYQNNNNIWLPEYLTLGVAIINVVIAFQKKMPTPKPFSNFLATTSLIYPNFIALQFTVLLPSDEHIESFHGTSSIIIVLASFFVLYWIYVLFEGEIHLDFRFPVSYKFREEQLKYQKIEQKLNWLMLTSLLILLIAALSLINKGIYQPVTFFAAFLAIMSNVAQIKNFEKYVKNSSLLFIFESQMFYVFNFFNPDAPNLLIAALTGIFLISFTTNFQLILKYQSEFNFQGRKIEPTTMGIVIAISSVVNYVIGSLSEFEGIVLLVAVIQWIFIIHTTLLMENKTKDTRSFIHIAAISAPITLFIAGVLKQADKFDQSSSLVKLILNLPIILIFIYVIFLSLNGDKLSVSSQEDAISTTRDAWYSAFIHPEKIYAPQLLLFILPNILVIYGKPYFFFPEANQALLIIYLVLYFLLLPVLFIVSERKEQKSFSILSSFWGYFSFLLAFILLGGAKQVYDKIIKPPPSNSNPQYIIPLEWAIFLFVVIFVVSISWTLSLSRRFDLLQINRSSEQNVTSQSPESNPNTLEA